MSLPSVSAIAAARVRRTRGDRLFCQTCTAYVGAAPRHHVCPGSPSQHVIDIHPASAIINE